MTQEDYVKGNGNTCPLCEGSAVQTTNLINLTMIGVDLEVECLDCNKVYTENYKLVGYNKDKQPRAKEVTT
jgi:hypothetical protein